MKSTHTQPMTQPFDGFREFNDCAHLTDGDAPCAQCYAARPPRLERTPDRIPAFRPSEWDESEILSALDTLAA